MEAKNKIIKIALIFVIGYSNLFAQDSGIKILEKVKENALSIENGYYEFTINSNLGNNLIPISGEFFIKDEKYFIETPDIDQLFDGKNIYTIIHENEEIIISKNNNTFFNFTPNQILNFFLDGYNLTFEKDYDKYIVNAYSKKDEFIMYKIKVNNIDFSIEQIEMFDLESDTLLNTFLTISYEYNLPVPPSLFKFDNNKYQNYLIVSEN